MTRLGCGERDQSALREELREGEGGEGEHVGPGAPEDPQGRGPEVEAGPGGEAQGGHGDETQHGSSSRSSRPKREAGEDNRVPERKRRQIEVPEVQRPKRPREDPSEGENKKPKESVPDEDALLVLHPANMRKKKIIQSPGGVWKRKAGRREATHKIESKYDQIFEARVADQVENQVKKILKLSHADKVWDQNGKMANRDDWHEAPTRAWDDITGVELDAAEVKKARMIEIGYARKKKVWRKMSRAEATKRGWKVVKTRWIDINKGDADNIIYRSRLVGKEFNNGDAEGLFAGTPPLEALRMLISEAATVEPRGRKKCIMINDVSRAFFEAPMQRNLCIELPEEELCDHERGQDLVGHLHQSLYGTRDAAANFQKEVTKVMMTAGFQRGKYLVYGDDFVTVGDRADCNWLKGKLESRFEIKSQIVGFGEDEAREERILIRVIRATGRGWEMEADQRHADIIIDQLNLKAANGDKTPCEEEKAWELEDNSTILQEKDARKYRELAARANYLAQDRPDIQFATKEVFRGMFQPTKGDLKKLRRLGRYLKSHPRTIMTYQWQRQQHSFQGCSDSDFAGCRRTAKSTSGGVIMAGGHYIKSWSSTQKTVALSSGEAELTALVKCSCELLGILQLAADWGQEREGDVLVDSSAALGVVARKGAGKLRHVRVGQLWVQEKKENGELNYKKIKGTCNPADLMTKALVANDILRYMEAAGPELRCGRADKSLHMAVD